MSFESDFKQAIDSKNKVKIIFYSKEDGKNIERICAPMDYGPSRRFNDGVYRYHVWDYYPDGGKKPHPIPLDPKNILSMDMIDEHFNPAEFITWDVSKSPWHYARDWGQYS